MVRDVFCHSQLWKCPSRSYRLIGIEDCADQFMQPSVASLVKHQIYMDDICIAVQHGEDLDAMIQEVDSGLKQGSFLIKKWVKTGDSLEKQAGDPEVLKKLSESSRPMGGVCLKAEGPFSPLGGYPSETTERDCVQYLSYDY